MMIMRLSRRQTSEQGGALVECSVLCTVMVPVFFLLSYIGNIIAVKQTTIQASRYAAWEQTINPSYQVPADTRFRFYEQADVPLKSRQTVGVQSAGVQGLWRLQHENDRPRSLSDFSETLVSFDSGGGLYLATDLGGNGVAASFGKSIHKAGKVLGSLDNVDWEIESDGLVSAGVQVNIVRNALSGAGGRACDGKQSTRVSGCVSAHNALMVDGWGVAGNTLAERRTRALVPGARLANTGKTLSRLGKIPFLAEFAGLENAFGAVDSTVLPLDRYSGPYKEAVQ